MGFEIAPCRLGALGANPVEPGAVGIELRGAVGVDPALDQREQRIRVGRGGQAEIDPAALLAPLDQARFVEHADVVRHPRLALAENQRQLADRQLHRAEQ